MKSNKQKINLDKYLVTPELTIRQVIEMINKNHDGIVLVVEGVSKKLLGTITDGDIRRYLLTNQSVEESCQKVMWDKPTTAAIGTKDASLLKIMVQKRIRNIPIVDNNNIVTGLSCLQDLVPKTSEAAITTAVIMAGGEGIRLRPITEKIPKPMVEVGGKPILENIVVHLAKAGLSKIVMCLNYRGEVIQEYFGDGSKFGVEIEYINEEKKLGTAGALSLLKTQPQSSFIVMNGDVLTNVSFNRLIEFHNKHRSVMTMAATKFNYRIPYGVLELAGPYIVDMKEKPSHQFLCNAGIYVLDPEVLNYIPDQTEFNMTDLFESLKHEGLPVTAFPIHEYWLDIGQKDDLEKARQEADSVLNSK
jgi:dTDP-glucose pyrophosphorylase